MSETHKYLTSRDNIMTNVGVHMRYSKPKHEFPMHDHEFHEIVLVTNGCANHYINGKVMPMNTGYLYFIRDTDVHTYSDFVGDTFEYYNLALDKRITDEIFAFLGKGFDKQSLFSPFLPPEVHLGKAETEALDNKFSSVFMLMNGDEEALLTKAKLLTVSLFSDHFIKNDIRSKDIPLWLEYAYKKMQLPKNFSKGTERFFEICGRRREHCTRMMKTYYGTTPNRYITALRMNYAASLLSSGDLTVSETAFECGYDSIPHFYSLFFSAFGISPGEYRERSTTAK